MTRPIFALGLGALMGLATAVPLAAETAAPNPAGQVFPARLAGHAVLPALSLIAPPEDAPRDAMISGKFAAGAGPVRQPMSVEGDVGKAHGSRKTGLFLPFIGQPVQGFSGYAMDLAGDGATYTLTDNGFGTKANSPDAMLFFHKIRPDFDAATMGLEQTIFLRDPDRKVPFRIAYEGTDSRYLTGADFDPESIQLVNGEIWIGEEFGPYLIRASLDGRVLDVFPTMMDGREIRSPDNPRLVVPAAAGKDWQSQRSGGYEGMGLQPGTGLLWAMFEKPLIADGGQPEGDFLRALAFDPAKGEWTGAGFRFRLAEGATAIGDFNFIDETRAMIIERDNGEGVPALKCSAGPADDCFPAPALVKRIVLIDTADLDAEGFARRIGHVDLMNVTDTEGLARLKSAGGQEGVFTFPFFTIEDVRRVNDTQIMVGNDNNLPFSAGRELTQAAANEIMLLDVPELLNAR
ncbi:esterase-like activity of phytase family protein [Frigidibacter sp. MR17.14]|uniref:esterase-like activity of phytase family protein n=1 Tax=Frigidibacter sp. MR17.14 TaxID=3126509 RepID=UPI003012B08F